jgi:hypothetical protein
VPRFANGAPVDRNLVPAEGPIESDSSAVVVRCDEPDALTSLGPRYALEILEKQTPNAKPWTDGDERHYLALVVVEAVLDKANAGAMVFCNQAGK